MTFTQRQLQDNEQRLRAVLGEKHHRLAADAGRDVADRALLGQVLVTGDDSIRRTITVGRRNIDWPSHLNLHRMPMLNALAAAYAHTRDERYAEAARDYIEDWIDRHPDRAAWEKAGDNVLALAIRVNLWTGSWPEFAGSPSFDDRFFKRVIASCVWQLDYLLALPSGCYNIRFTNANALLVIGLRLTDLPEAEAWRKGGVWMLNDAIRRQFYDDGAHVELNHQYNQLWLVEKCRLLQQGYPELGLTLDPNRLSRMQDYQLALTQPNGDGTAFHDSPYRRHTGPRLANWAASYLAQKKEAGQSAELPATSQHFPVAGQACWRSSWDEDAVYVTFDASRWARYHTHLSRNAIQVSAYGRNLLIDPSFLSYGKDDPWTFHGKSTRAHNTVNLNGWNQCEANPESRFASVPGYDLACGHYAAGYWSGRHDWGFRDYDPARGHGRGIWGSHHRTLLWVRDRFLVVLDRVVHGGLGAGLDSPVFLESNWQFTPGELAVDESAGSVHTRHEDGNLLMLFPLCASEGGQKEGRLRFSVHAGEKDPLRGWLLQANRRHPIPQLCVCLPEATAYTDLATVIVPYRGRGVPRLSAAGKVTPKIGRVTLAWDDGRTDTVIWNHHLEFAIDGFDGGRTDASLLHLHRDAGGRVLEGMAFDATVVEPFAPVRRPRPEMFTFGPEQE